MHHAMGLFPTLERSLSTYPFETTTTLPDLSFNRRYHKMKNFFIFQNLKIVKSDTDRSVHLHYMAPFITIMHTLIFVLGLTLELILDYPTNCNDARFYTDKKVTSH